MEIPASFLQRLKTVDPQLVVYWNAFKGCYMIDRKVEGQVNTNVLICKADNGDSLPLNDRLIARIQSMDAWREFGTYEAYHAHHLNLAAEDKVKREAAIKESYRLASLDDKIQLRKAHHTLQQLSDIITR